MSGQTIRAVIIPVFLALIFFSPMLITSCGCPSIIGAYDVEQVYLLKSEKEEIIGKFRPSLRLSFFEDFQVSLPFYKDNPRAYPVKYSTYHYDRKECRLIIDDHIQNFFCGEYSVQFFAGDPPQVWLESDKLRIILKERRFTLEQPFIPIEWPDRPKRDSI